MFHRLRSFSYEYVAGTTLDPARYSRMEQDKPQRTPPEKQVDRVIIKSPVSLAIFAVAILGLGAAALSLMSDAMPLVS